MKSFELSSLQQPDYSVYGNQHLPLPQSDESCSLLPVTRSTMIFVLCAALNSCNLGYDIGVSTNVTKLVQEDFQLSDLQREVFVGFINFWAGKLIFSDIIVTMVRSAFTTIINSLLLHLKTPSFGSFVGQLLY
jgi:hypothetical protein